MQGGGSTFGVITRFVVRAWPTPQITAGIFSLSAKPNSTAAVGIGSLVLSKLPDMMDLGFTGYMWSSANTPNLANASTDMGGVFGVLAIERPDGAKILEDLWGPIVAEAQRRWGKNNIDFLMQPTVFPSLLKYVEANHATFLTGVDKYIDSRMLSAEALRGEPADLVEFNRCAAARAYGDSTGVMLVSGKGLQKAKPRGGSNAVHPFWRKSVALLSKHRLGPSRE